MATWNLKCTECGSTFEHSKIEETFENYFWPAKPKVAAEGFEAKCPNCGKDGKYLRTDFTLQKD